MGDPDQLAYVSSQVDNILDIHASLAEENTFHIAEENEWESEWNKGGIASRLSVQVNPTSLHVAYLIDRTFFGQDFHISSP